VLFYDGNRVKQVAPNGEVTVYMGGLYEVTYSSGGTLKNTKLYYTWTYAVSQLRFFLSQKVRPNRVVNAGGVLGWKGCR
jgi:hypothetical protein